MKLWFRRLPLVVAGLAIIWTVTTMVSQTQAPARGGSTPAAPARGAAATTYPKAGVYFKNVTTSTLKELSVDDFIASMGVMTDALGLDCADCHPNAGSDQVDWVFDTQ